jgi:hypothetical protein
LSPPLARFATSQILAGLVGVGVLLRLAIFCAAEHSLEVSEAIVGLMALDILAGQALPFFFYGTAYNGGGALEAYLAAGSFALFGASAAGLKLWILALWALAAGLFANLCGRTLTRGAAILAVAFFSLGTPFFLEWSLKARGGFIETVLFSVLLLWLAAPPPALRARRDLQCAGFGLAVGIGLWSSEMLLAMIPCAGAWLWFGLERRERGRALLVLGTATLVSLIPLLVYNLGHEWQHARGSVLLRVLQPADGEPLSLEQLQISAAFVLGRAWPLLALLFVVGGARLLERREAWPLGLVALAHTGLYLTAYWLSGERYLSVPPSRVLFSLYPSLALLFASALDPPRRGGIAVRGLVVTGIAAWALAVCGSIHAWIGSGAPREASSWRGSWALTDGAGLHRELVSLGVAQVYASRWTVPPLVFAQRSAQADDANAPRLRITSLIPLLAPADRASTAIVLLREGPLAGYLALAFEHHGVAARRVEWNGFSIFYGMRASQIHQGIDLPAVLAKTDWPPEPDPPDGFN